jgi:hypothetical protein
MKKFLSSALILALSLSAAKGLGNELTGTVLQVIPSGGLLVEGVYETDRTDKLANIIFYRGTFFLTGYPDEINEGASIQGRAKENGLYTYLTAIGAERTVHSLIWND